MSRDRVFALYRRYLTWGAFLGFVMFFGAVFGVQFALRHTVGGAALAAGIEAGVWAIVFPPAEAYFRARDPRK